MSMDATEALRILRITLESKDTTIANLLTRGANQDRQVETLERRASLAEANAAALETERTRLTEKASELASKVQSLTLRVEDAEHRAVLHETRSQELQEKGERHDRIEPACEKLLATLGALPLDMADAGIIPGAARPKIELYGTYDWQNVMDAKFALMQAMRREE